MLRIMMQRKKQKQNQQNSICWENINKITYLENSNANKKIRNNTNNKIAYVEHSDAKKKTTTATTKYHMMRIETKNNNNNSKITYIENSYAKKKINWRKLWSPVKISLIHGYGHCYCNGHPTKQKGWMREGRGLFYQRGPLAVECEVGFLVKRHPVTFSRLWLENWRVAPERVRIGYGQVASARRGSDLVAGESPWQGPDSRISEPPWWGPNSEMGELPWQGFDSKWGKLPWQGSDSETGESPRRGSD